MSKGKANKIRGDQKFLENTDYRGVSIDMYTSKAVRIRFDDSIWLILQATVN